jgi:hypothetical protein
MLRRPVFKRVSKCLSRFIKSFAWTGGDNVGRRKEKDYE